MHSDTLPQSSASSARGILPQVTAVEAAEEYVLLVTFEDGQRRRYDMAEELNGSAFEPLRDRTLFCQVSTDGYGLAWPNGADIDRANAYLGGEPLP